MASKTNMASKTYTVEKDGTILKELKTLAAAKKLADAENVVVVCNGETVYQGIGETVVETASEMDTIPAPVPVIEAVTPDCYRLTHLMNVRSGPSMEANKLSTLPAGEEISVLDIVDDWLHLADGTFILYGGGKFAEKI